MNFQYNNTHKYTNKSPLLWKSVHFYFYHGRNHVRKLEIDPCVNSTNYDKVDELRISKYRK